MEMKTCEEFIDIEFVSASSNLLCFYISSPPHSTDFEFHKLPAAFHDPDSTPSPADELFYRGKLLPLHLPPRLLMVDNLKKPSVDPKMPSDHQGQNNDPFIAISRKLPATPNKSVFESNSPSQSRRVSADEFSSGWSAEMRSFMNDDSGKSWFRNLKQSSFGQKLKTSRAFLRSLFGKSGCTDYNCTKAAHNKKLIIRNGNRKVSAATMKQTGKGMPRDAVTSQRRSFSGAINWSSGTNKRLSSSSFGSTSSSWSSSSTKLYDIQLLTRSYSFNLEIENPIEGAISHCKKSQKLS